MKAIISVYKSEIVAYMKENKLKKEEVCMICSNAEIEPNKEKFDEVVLLSAPMGVPNKQDYLEGILLKKATPSPAPKKSTSAPKAAQKKAAKEQKFGKEGLTQKEIAEGKDPINTEDNGKA